MKSQSIKKILVFLVCLVAMTVVFAITSFAEDYGNFTYSRSEDESYITITGVNIDEDDPQVIEIPEYIDDVPVTTIGNDAFKGKNNIGDVVIPKTVTTIGSAAFANCDSIVNVIIGEGVKEIGTSAFYECSALESVYFYDNSVEKIGDIAFKDCPALKNVHFGAGIKEIGKGAFFGCHELKAIIVSKDVKLGDYALGYWQNGDKVDSTGLIVHNEKQSCDDFSEWSNIRVATNSYVGLDMRACAKCGCIEIRDNTEIPVVKNESATVSIIVIAALCVIFGIVCAIYVKKEKARRNLAIEEYKKNSGNSEQ